MSAPISEAELREIVFSEVREHGPKEARRRLKLRANTDFEFMLAAAKYGHVIVQALRESKGATLQ